MTVKRRDPSHGLIAKDLEHLAKEDTAQSRKILVQADQVAEEEELDDGVLREIVAARRSRSCTRCWP